MKQGKLNRLITYILSHPQFSSQQIQDLYNCSNKTARTYLNECKDYLKDWNLILTSKQSKGYKLEYKHADLLAFQSEWKSFDKPINYTSIDRINAILFRCLRSNKPLHISRLEQLLFISRTSLYSDLIYVNEYLHTFNLKLTSKHKKGLVLEGDERSKRSALSTFIIGIIHSYPIIIDKELQLFLDYLTSNSEKNSRIKQLLINFEKETQMHISSKDIIPLTIRIHISLDRIEKGECVCFTDDELEKFKLFSFFKCEQALVEKLSILNVPLSTSEAFYITSLFYTLENSTFNETVSFEIYQQAQLIIDQFKEIVYQNFYIEHKDIFERGLFYHITKILEKAKLDYIEKSLYLEQILTEFSGPYLVACKILPIIERVTSLCLPNDEAVFVSLHIAAAIEKSMKPIHALFVFEHRYSEAKYASSLIEAHVKEVLLLKTVDYSQFLNLDNLSEFHIILTTFSLPVEISIPTYKIPIIPSKAFIENLRLELRSHFIKINFNALSKLLSSQ